MYIHGYCRYEGKGCAFRHDRVQWKFRMLGGKVTDGFYSLILNHLMHPLKSTFLPFWNWLTWLDRRLFWESRLLRFSLGHNHLLRIFLLLLQTQLYLYLEVKVFWRLPSCTDVTGLSSPPLSNTSVPTPEPSIITPALTPLASSLYLQFNIRTDPSTPMLQPSLSQTSENNPYADMEMYGNNSNYLDQVTNGYNQMNLGQVSAIIVVSYIRLPITRLIWV